MALFEDKTFYPLYGIQNLKVWLVAVDDFHYLSQFFCALRFKVYSALTNVTIKLSILYHQS